MGSTNTTPNYELSQFIGTDKPAWLQDYNGDMLKIDTGIAGAKTAADNAQSAADGAQGDATSALSSIADINTELGTVETTLAGATGNINTINSLIGNGLPTTTDKTIIGAINELHDDVSGIEGLTAYAYTGTHSVSVYGDGVKTRAELLLELTALVNDYADTNTNYLLKDFNIGGQGVQRAVATSYSMNGVTSNNHATSGNFIGSIDGRGVESARIATNSSNCRWYSHTYADNTITDKSSDVLTSEQYMQLTFAVYAKISS